MEPETRSTGSRGAVAILSVALVVTAGVLVVGLQRAKGASAIMSSINNMKQIAIGTIFCSGTFGGKVPPSAGPWLNRDGTLYYHILPFVEEGNTYNLNKRDARVRVYVSPRDETNRQDSNLLSYASNFTVFGRESRNLADVTKLHGASNVIGWMERYAVVGKHEHRWPDTADGATWLVGGDAGIQVNVPAKHASNTDAHAMGEMGLCVGMADGSMKVLKPTTKPRTFQWACDPEDEDPEPRDWQRSGDMPQSQRYSRWSTVPPSLFVLVGVAILVVVGLLLRELMRCRCPRR
jgi:hypothetical protein